MEQKPVAPESAEKQLLKIIETSPSGAASVSAGGQAAIRAGAVRKLKDSSPKKNPIFSVLPDFSKIFKSFSDSIKEGDFFQAQIKYINFALLFISVCLIAGLGFYFARLKAFSEKPIGLSKDEAKSAIEKFDILPGVSVPLAGDDYLANFLAKLKKRDVFNPVKLDNNAPVAPDKAAEAEEILKQLKLVGVSVSNDPLDSYAMIEDSKSKITYFLKNSDTIQGLKVIRIEDDTVVFDYQGREVTLR